jgi:hypothetical protein
MIADPGNLTLVIYAIHDELTRVQVWTWKTPNHAGLHLPLWDSGLGIAGESPDYSPSKIPELKQQNIAGMEGMPVTRPNFAM